MFSYYANMLTPTLLISWFSCLCSKYSHATNQKRGNGNDWIPNWISLINMYNKNESWSERWQQLDLKMDIGPLVLLCPAPCSRRHQVSKKSPHPQGEKANKNGWQKTLRGHSRPDVNKKSKRTIKRRDRKDPNLQPKEFEAAEWRAQKHTKIRMQFL